MSPLAVGLERRLVVLMAARLVLSLLSLGIALTLDALGYNTVTGWNGFYATVTLAFLATVGFGVVLPRVRRQRRFAALNIATDIAIVSALVLFSGANESVFTFLYLLVAFYGAVLFERPGALLAASLSALAYGSVLVAGAWDPLSGSFAGSSDWPPLLMHWALHAGAVVLVAALASFLAGELRRSDEALQQRTHDLHRLQSFHRRIVDSLMSGLLTTDDSGRVTSFNPEAERITGLSARAATGRDLETVLPGAREAVLGAAGDVHNASARAQIAYRNEEGAERHLGLGGYVLRDDAGAAAGYVVLYTNPRGSTSYGDEFANEIHHNYPGQDYDDLMSGVDAVIARGYVDEDQLFVTGGSGGGVLSAWIVGKTDRFAAAVVAKPVINWISETLYSDIHTMIPQYWFEKYPWEDPEGYWARSPLSLVGNVSTPTMLLTGESDHRTPIPESEQYYQALKLRKIDSALVRVPESSHGIASRPSNQIAKVDNILAWFARYRTDAE